MIEHINGAEVSDDTLIVVIDGVGRQIIGKINVSLQEALKSPVVAIQNPILMMDQPHSDGRINIAMQPISQVEMIDVLHVRWISMYETKARVRLSSYSEIVVKLRAASNGIIMATQVPREAFVGRN